MSKWEMVKLGEVATYINGYAFKPIDWGKDGVPIIRIQNLTGKAYETNCFNGEYNSKYEVNDGDILIAWSASLGVYEWNGGKALLNQHIFKVAFDKVEVSKTYFFYAVNKVLLESSNQTHGSTMKHITKSRFDNLLIPLPPLDEQKRIAEELDKISGLIAKRKSQLEKLDLLVKAKFVEMFGDPVTNPMGWKKENLSNLSEIKIGPFGSLLHKEDYVPNEHPLVNPSHIDNGNIAIDNELTVNDEKYCELAPYHLKIGDIVLGRRGEMGRCAVVTKNGLLCGTGSLIIRPNKEMTSYILQKIIAFPTFKKNIENSAVGVTMLNLNVPIVSNFKIPLYPMELQLQYIEFISKTKQTKTKLQQGMEQLETLYKARMQDYFE